MNKIISTVALTLVASAFTAFAQEAPAPAAPAPTQANNPPAKPRHEKKWQPLLAALDANHDGVIDAQEIANAPAALKTLDKNGDGKLTRDEYLPPRREGKPPRAEAKEGEHRGGPGHLRNPLLAALDANGDGVIDAQEIANASAALKRLDKNGDGQLTRDELRRPCPDGDKGPGMKDGARKHRNKPEAPAPSATPAATPL